MLDVVPVISAVLLAVAYRAARPAPEPVRWGGFVLCGLAGASSAVGPAGRGVFAPAAAFLIAALAVALLAWPLARSRVRSFVPFMAAAFFGAYGLATYLAFQPAGANDDLRDRSGFVSMTVRVPEPAAASCAQADPRLNAFQASVAQEGERSLRGAELRRLHDDTVSQFVNRFGFGVGRVAMPGQPWEPRRRPTRQDDSPTPPGPSSDWDPPADLASAMVGPAVPEMHAASGPDGLAPQGVGASRGRRQFAGVVPHGFSRVSVTTGNLAVRRVELVGLLKHSGPVVYISEKLPAMGDLRDAPTRPLDAFESAGLTAVRCGADLYSVREGVVVRAVGSIRNGNDCVGCHGGKRGDLLGAFAYVLVRP